MRVLRLFYYYLKNKIGYICEINKRFGSLNEKLKIKKQSNTFNELNSYYKKFDL